MDESQVISWYNEQWNETPFFASSIHQALSTGSSVRCSDTSGLGNTAVLLVVWHFPDGYKWQWLQHRPLGSSSEHLPHSRETSASDLQAGVGRVPQMKAVCFSCCKGPCSKLLGPRNLVGVFFGPLRLIQWLYIPDSLGQKPGHNLTPLLILPI